VAWVLATAIFLGLGIFLAGLLSMMLSITDLSRCGDRMRWTVPFSGGTQVLAAACVYIVGMRSTEWVLLPLLAAPILISGLLLLSPLWAPRERGVSKKCPCPNCDGIEYTEVTPEGGGAIAHDRVCRGCGTRYTPPTPLWVAVLLIASGVFLALPGIVTIGVVIKMAITMQQGTIGAVLAFWWCVAISFLFGSRFIVHGWRSIGRGSVVREGAGAGQRPGSTHWEAMDRP
jgi:hypothetical protein